MLQTKTIKAPVPEFIPPRTSTIVNSDTLTQSSQSLNGVLMNARMDEGLRVELMTLPPDLAAKWLKRNHLPIYMQERFPEAPASIRYPFETMITEFPRGYMTNQSAYMIALALMSGVTHLAVYGCHYQAKSEYWAQRGSMEYWLGVAEGRGVTVLIPPTCDLLNRPSLLYGYQSHPNGKRDASYDVDGVANVPKPETQAGADPVGTAAAQKTDAPGELCALDDKSIPEPTYLPEPPTPERWGLK